MHLANYYQFDHELASRPEIEHCPHIQVHNSPCLKYKTYNCRPMRFNTHQSLDFESLLETLHYIRP